MTVRVAALDCVLMGAVKAFLWFKKCFPKKLTDYKLISQMRFSLTKETWAIERA